MQQDGTMYASYVVEPAATGWRVRRVNYDDGVADSADDVLHRLHTVALAYADAAAALERYLSSLDQNEDSAELFETWRSLDDLYEMMAIELRDAPMLVVNDVRSVAAFTRH